MSLPDNWEIEKGSEGAAQKVYDKLVSCNTIYRQCSKCKDKDFYGEAIVGVLKNYFILACKNCWHCRWYKIF